MQFDFSNLFPNVLTTYNYYFMYGYVGMGV